MSNLAGRENIEFKVIKEDWNQYEFKNDIVIRGRTFVTRIQQDPISTANSDKPNYKMQFQNHFVVFAPNRECGTPTSPLPNPQQITKDMIQEIEALTNSEPWNTYEIIKNGTIVKVKLVVNEFIRVIDKFDQFGQPFFIINSGQAVNIKVNTSAEKFA